MWVILELPRVIKNPSTNSDASFDFYCALVTRCYYITKIDELVGYLYVFIVNFEIVDFLKTKVLDLLMLMFRP